MTRRTAKQAATKIAAVLGDNGYTALFAGGCVRDELLGRPPKDYDVATDAPPETVVELFPKTSQVGAKFGVVIVRLGGRQTEVATFRSDGAYLDGRHPERVTFSDAKADAARRDFTINGMFLDPQDGRVIDYVGGRVDLQDRLIRAIGEPDRRFAEDHLRMLRAVRFATQLGFTMEPQTARAIRTYANHLTEISQERIRMELERVLGDPARGRGWELLADSKLTPHLVPGFTWSAAELRAVNTRLAGLPERCPWPVPLAVLFHNQSPTPAETLCKRLTCGNSVAKDVGWLLVRLAFCLATDHWELADLKTVRADCRAPGLCMLLEAELIGREAPLDLHRSLTSRLEQIDPSEAAPDPLLTGDDLLGMGLQPGPIYSVILDRVYRSQLNEEIAAPAEALALARRLADDQQATPQ
ncbi:MAG: CCA tRNA nucleotidyltransferase [Planctomycetes bacterium]|nr:CCA tRNA nucleotidyltransferase [Planctomycetota bacterium]